jgi:hypothetical protein
VNPRCEHCGSRPSRRLNGLCDACNSYLKKYGKLPDEAVLIRRGVRQQVRPGRVPSIKVRVRRANRARLYGLSPSDITRMLEDQGGACPLCLRPFPRDELGEAVFVVDHSHATGIVRGLLCGPCNRALGTLGDEIDGIERALSYLRRASRRRSRRSAGVI